jgi:hypothetical protein
MRLFDRVGDHVWGAFGDQIGRYQLVDPPWPMVKGSPARRTQENIV